MRPLHVLVVGAGAIGSLVGGKLAQSGNTVTLVGRARLVTAVRAQGLRLQIGQTVQHVENLHAVCSTAEAFALVREEQRPYQLAILSVKSYDTEKALTELAEAVRAHRQPAPPILTLQNGVGNEEAIAARFGADKVIAGTITAPVETPAPGLIQVAKPKYQVGLAAWDAGLDEELLHQVQQTLRAAGIAVTRYADARSMKWSKLLMNMIGNATSAILAEPPQQTFADPRIADLEIEALREALAVMQATRIQPVNLAGYPLSTFAPLFRYAPKALLRPVLRRLVAGARGGKMPSLSLDLEQGKPENEVNWYNGAVVRAGANAGVATPVNQILNETVLRLAASPTERARWRGDHERLVGLVRAGD